MRTGAHHIGPHLRLMQGLGGSVIRASASWALTATSHSTAMPLPPLCSTSASVSLAPDRFRSRIATRAPWALPDLPARSEGAATSGDLLLSYSGPGQKEIADAVWANVNAGDPLPLTAIARKLKTLPGPLQAYLLAASRDVKRCLKDLQAWKRDFDRAQRDADAGRGKNRKEGEGIAGAAAGVVTAVAAAAAAANAVPVVGQVVSALMALGLAIGVAIAEANTLPVRKAEDQIRPGYEGLTVFWGFPVEAPENSYANPFLTLKQAVVQDDVAFSLPAVPPRTRFDFAPRLAAFQEAAHELGLYPEDEIQDASL